MKVLFDEDVPGKLGRFLPEHEIHTVVSMHWGGVKNSALLELIAEEHFHVFLTGDKNMEKQQRLVGLLFAVLIMSAINWPVIRPHIDKISLAITSAEPGSVNTIDCGVFIHRANRPGV